LPVGVATAIVVALGAVVAVVAVVVVAVVVVVVAALVGAVVAAVVEPADAATEVLPSAALVTVGMVVTWSEHAVARVVARTIARARRPVTGRLSPGPLGPR